jgi:hypothetical protein
MTRITICGPNLNDQNKGQFHVHAAGCGDLKHYGPGRKLGGEDGGWEIEVDSRLDASAAVYADHLSDHGLSTADAEGTAMLRDWLSDFHFAPCCADLPAETPELTDAEVDQIFEADRPRPAMPLFEVTTSTLYYSNDGRLHVVFDGDEFALVLLPAGTTTVDTSKGDEVFRTKLRALADAYIAGYDERERLSREEA